MSATSKRVLAVDWSEPTDEGSVARACVTLARELEAAERKLADLHERITTGAAAMKTPKVYVVPEAPKPGPIPGVALPRLIVSCIVDPGPAHDRVRVWVRGQSVGALTVGAGDGEALARRLCRPPYPNKGSEHERIEDERGAVSFFEPPEEP